jgi:hypothetical protein
MTTTKPNPYDRRKNKIDPKDYAKLNSKWVTKPSQTQDGAIDRVRIWDGLNVFAAKHQARIISPAHSYPVRLETPPDSDLPDKFRSLGYDVVFKSEDTRIGGPVSPEYQARWRRGVKPTGYGFYTVSVFELNLPKLRSDPTGKAGIPVQ